MKARQLKLLACLAARAWRRRGWRQWTPVAVHRWFPIALRWRRVGAVARGRVGTGSLHRHLHTHLIRQAWWMPSIGPDAAGARPERARGAMHSHAQPHPNALYTAVSDATVRWRRDRRNASASRVRASTADRPSSVRGRAMRAIVRTDASAAQGRAVPSAIVQSPAPRRVKQDERTERIEALRFLRRTTRATTRVSRHVSQHVSTQDSMHTSRHASSHVPARTSMQGSIGTSRAPRPDRRSADLRTRAAAPVAVRVPDPRVSTVDITWRTASTPRIAPTASAADAAMHATTPVPQASAAPSIQAAPGPTLTSAPSAACDASPAFIERIADDVLRRIDRRARIERERRGL